MKLHRLHLPPVEFRRLSALDRAVMVRLANMYNEIAILLKLLVWALNSEPRTKKRSPFELAEYHGRNCQAFLLTRLLIGKLDELTRFFTMNVNLEERGEGRSFQPERYFSAYFNDKTKPAHKAYERLKDRDVLVKGIRDSSSFHYTMKDIFQNIGKIEDDDLFMYLNEGNAHANNLFYFAEAGENLSSATKTISGTLHDGWDEIFANVKGRSIDALTVLTYLVKALLEGKFELADIKFEEIEVGELPSLENLSIPFFTQRGDD